MANTIKIKRRLATGSAGPPTVGTMAQGELAYNEADNKLYYGFGDNGSGVATSIPAIGGTGNFVTIDTAQTITGTKAFTPVVNANGGISTTSGNLVLDSTGGTIDINDNVDISGDLTVGGDLEFTGINSGSAGDFLVNDTGTISTRTAAQIIGDLEAGTDGVVTKSGAQVIAGIKSFTFLKSDGISSKTTNGNLTLTGHGTGIVNINDNTTIGGTLGVTGVTTLTALVNANGGIAVDTDKFTVADATGNTVIAGTLGIGVTPNASYKLDVLGTIHASTEIYTTGNLSAAANVEVQGSATIGTTAAATSAHQGFLVRENAAGLVKVRAKADVLSDIGAASATDNSTDVTLIAGTGYLSLSGQEITAGVVALTTHTSGSYVASLNQSTGVTITGNVGAEGATPTISIGQPVATTDNVTFASITTSADIEVGTSLDVIGDAEVQGTTTLTQPRLQLILINFL